MWKLGRGRVLPDDPLEEEDLRGALPSAPAAQAQGVGFRGWRDVFGKDDEQHLLQTCKPPRTREAALRLKEELKAEKKSGFWDGARSSTLPKRPDQVGGPDALGDAGPPRDDERKGAKQGGLAASGHRWALRSAGRLVSIRRQSRGHQESWEELE